MNEKEIKIKYDDILNQVKDIILSKEPIDEQGYLLLKSELENKYKNEVK